MINYAGAIKRPFTDFKKFLIGFLLLVIPFVNIITGVIARGYFLECGKGAMGNKKKLPEWKGFWDLFVKGLISMIIVFLYGLPFIIILGIFAGGVLLNIGLINFLSPSPELIASLIASVGALIFLILIMVLFLAYVLPMSLMSYVSSWKFKDGFNFRRIFRKAFTGKYFVAWIVVIAYGILLGLLIGIVSFIPAVGTFIGAALSNFILSVTSYTIFGEAYKQIK